MTQVYVWNISHTRLSDEDLPTSVSAEEHERIRRINLKNERRRKRGAKVLLHTILQRLYGISQPDFQRNAWGRPFLSNHPELSCGISHSGDYVMCGIDTIQNGIGIGVDIEKKIMHDWQHFKPALAYSEIHQLEETPKPLQMERFTFLWVCKESYLKALGVGFSISPSRIAINFHTNLHTTKAMVKQSPFKPEAVIKTSKVTPYYYAVSRPTCDSNIEVKLIDSISEV
ncbi:MAG: 4'-phosphopantetheinyl transferase superfamily protein [Spirochaetaceae bacterium]|nr:4'-phosphopantetheinyl transferase superfamily protein [Spirochaetaceae bacterium]MCF7938986.1 4'-phosphopantetheinyl transferase superfamily protein [Spirochaetales bacterium]